MRYFLEIAYLGTKYHGWQHQINSNSVQDELEKALGIILNETISINGSSRTDTGVHASQQYAHFESTKKIKADQVVNRLNKLLPIDISVKSLSKVLPTHHTRFDAVSRKYIYRISSSKLPFTGHITAQYTLKLDVDLMNQAAQYLIGEQDFECFSKVKTDVKTFFCNIEEAYWIQNNETLEFHIKANRFLRGMVRAIVGSLMDVGKGKIDVSQFQKIIQSKDRKMAGNAAKAQGLTLQEVNYPVDYFKNEFLIKEAEDDEMPMVKDLFITYQKYLGISLCFQSFEQELESLPKPYNMPKGAILLLKHRGEAVGVVALKPLEDGSCEMKRLFVLPAFHGFGQGKALALAIIQKARDLQYKEMKLDTLKRLTEAVSMYQEMGFQSIEPYNFNPESDILYFSKKL